MNVVVSLNESRESVLAMESLREWVRPLWGVSDRCGQEYSENRVKNLNNVIHVPIMHVHAMQRSGT